MKEAEQRLKAAGCPKINLQVRETNVDTLQFYQSIGYVQDRVVSLGKRLIKDNE
jgi:ribosomal protein S18 acetylase RimI-like enzyme